MKNRYFTVDGKEIKMSIDPYYAGVNNAKEDKPADFVMIKQAEINEVVTDPYGNEQEIHKLSEPLEELYFRWVWENDQWYCLCCLIVKNKTIVMDRRPSWWKFFEEFNANRPRFTV